MYFFFSLVFISLSLFFFFFFNDTATTEIYTLSLHDALPISGCAGTAAMWLPTSSLCGRQLSSDARGRRCPRAVRSTAASPPAVVAGRGVNDAPPRPGGGSLGPLPILLGAISLLFLVVCVVFSSR